VSSEVKSSSNVLIPVAINIPPPQQQVDPHKQLFDNSNIALEKAKKALLEAETVVGQLEEVVRDQASLLALEKLKISLRGVQETSGHLDDSRTFLKQTRGILDLPDVAMKHLLSKLSFTDKCNLRLTCESLMLNVRNLDKCFRTWFIDLHQDCDTAAFQQFEQVDAQVNLTLIAKFSDFVGDEIGKLLWKAHKIVNDFCHKNVINLRCDSKIAHFLNFRQSLPKLTSLETLHVVDDEETLHDVQHLSGCLSKNIDSLVYLNLQGVNTKGLKTIMLTTLKQLDLSDSIIDSFLFFPNLEEVNLYSCIGDASSLLTCCAHNLESFTSEDNNLIRLEKIQNKFDKLAHIRVKNSGVAGVEHLVSLSTHCVESLTILNQDISIFEEWTTKFVKLKEIELKFPFNIGKSAINNLLRCCSTTLEALDFKLNDTEQLVYLRCMFPHLYRVLLSTCNPPPTLRQCNGYSNLLRLCAPTVRQVILPSVKLDEYHLDFKFHQLTNLFVYVSMREVQKCLRPSLEVLTLFFEEDVSTLQLDLFVNLRKLVLHGCKNYVPLLKVCSSSLTTLIFTDNKVKLSQLPLADINFARLSLVEVDPEVEESEIDALERNLPNRVLIRRNMDPIEEGD